MPDIKTTYMGLELKSPIIAASSGLTDNIDNLQEIEKYGAGAVVLKSLFEEEIVAEMQKTQYQMQGAGFTFPEMGDMYDFVDTENGVVNYLHLIENAKKSIDIPVIASINCQTAQKWTYFGKKIEEAGADALELNIFLMPSDFDQESPEKFEQTYFDIIDMVQREVSIPVSVKMSYYFTLLGKTLQAISNSGIRGLVLFNRFFNPDYDISDLKVIPSNVFSHTHDLAISLKWIAIMHGRAGCDLAASTGVHDGDGLIKQMLAGADAVQIASTLYKHGFETIQFMNNRLFEWMSEKGFNTLAEFKGRLSQKNIKHPAAFERVQFVKNFRSMK